MTVEHYVLFLGLAFFAEIIGTLSGFGSSILFVPLATLFFDFKTVLGITAIFHVFSNISKVALFGKNIDQSIAFKLGIPAILFVLVGAWLTAYIEQEKIAFLMSILLIVLSVLLLITDHFSLPKNNLNLYLGGVLSGFLAGLIGTGGAIRGITLIAFNLEKNVFVATSALIDLGVDFSRAVVYIWNGYFLVAYLPLIFMLMFISFLGTYVGKVVLEYTSQKAFRYVVLIVILCNALLQIFNLFS
ncbi:MAG: sulfite exporter TauE/SafE family protein [Cytophagales bacterium]|nr:MAG: sulfite exporter TauE/SafE family protein [Cytophagales bacterium]